MSEIIGSLPKIYLPIDVQEPEGRILIKLKRAQETARRYLERFPKSEVAQSTAKNYEDKVRHLEVVCDVPVGSLKFQGLLQMVWTSKRSFYAYRAAIIYVCMNAVRDGLRELERPCERASSMWMLRVARMKEALRLLEDVEPLDVDEDDEDPISIRWLIDNTLPSSNARRRNLRDLNAHGDWLRKVWDAAKDGEHADLIAVLILTGCRPAELLKGVHISITDAGALSLRVRGAKVRDGDGPRTQTGQAWREILVSIDMEPAHHLARAIARAGGEVVVGGDFKANFGDRARELRRVVRDLGKAALGDDVSLAPYDFRHAFSAYLKRDDTIEHDEIAKALGQRSTTSQTHYGMANQVGTSARAKVVGVRSAQPVRRPNRGSLAGEKRPE